VLPLLTALADQSLLGPEDNAGVTRFRMLETVWQYANDRLREAGGLVDWRARHLAYFVAWVEGAEAGLKGPEQGAWLKRLETEHDNLRAALRESLASPGQVDAGLRLVAVLWRFWSNRGHANEGLVWARQLLADRPEAFVTALTANALHGAGVMAHTVCDYAAADGFHQEALTIRRTLADHGGVADSLHCLSSSAMVQGHYERAEALATECLAMRRQLGNPRSLAGSLNNVASLAAIRGDLLAAAPLFEEAVRLHRAAGNDHGIALGLVNLGVIAGSLGDLALSEQRHEEALRIHRALDDRRAIAMDLVHLGQVALERHDQRRARAHYRECLSSVREQGDPLGAVELLQGVARLALAGGKAPAAARLYGAAERRREDMGAPIEPVDRPAHDGRIRSLRAALADDGAFERAWRLGRSMSLEEALREAALLC
jgi:tetratricopeptide (TPR) repeat protein